MQCSQKEIILESGHHLPLIFHMNLTLEHTLNTIDKITQCEMAWRVTGAFCKALECLPGAANMPGPCQACSGLCVGLACIHLISVCTHVI